MVTAIMGVMAKSNAYRYSSFSALQADMEDPTIPGPKVHLRHPQHDETDEPQYLNATPMGAATGEPGDQSMTFQVEDAPFPQVFSEHSVAAWNVGSWRQ